MKRVIQKLFVVVLLLVFAGCSGGIPKGTDSDVKDLVLKITKNEIKKQITTSIYQDVTRINVAFFGMKVSYEDLKRNIDKDDNRKVVKEIDSFMSKLTLALSNIRTDSIQEDIKKSTSSAELKVNDKVMKITYTAQYNDDGRLYVEVFGLK